MNYATDLARLTSRVHLRDKGTTTNHACPPPAIAGRPRLLLEARERLNRSASCGVGASERRPQGGLDASAYWVQGAGVLLHRTSPGTMIPACTLVQNLAWGSRQIQGYFGEFVMLDVGAPAPTWFGLCHVGRWGPGPNVVGPLSCWTLGPRPQRRWAVTLGRVGRVLGACWARVENVPRQSSARGQSRLGGNAVRSALSVYETLHGRLAKPSCTPT
jgi:hypothetical protein